MQKFGGRSVLPVPDHASEDYRRRWDDLTTTHAPFSLTDAFLDDETLSCPDLHDVSWAGLYPLAGLTLAAMVGKPLHPTPARSTGASLSTDPIRNEFLRARELATQSFARFLVHWGLQPILAFPTATELGKTTADPDARLLGLHLLSSLLSAEAYICRWSTNTAVQESEAIQSHPVLSRNVDLICSELLANAFDHGWKPSTEVTVASLPRIESVIARMRAPSDAFWVELLRKLREVGAAIHTSEPSNPSGREEEITSLLEAMNHLLTQGPIEDLARYSGCSQQRLEALQTQAGNDMVLYNRLVLEAIAPESFLLPRPFIMAKLCRPESAWRALRSHDVFEHLTSCEYEVCQLSVRDDICFLELAIADPGSGFWGNSVLRQSYETAIGRPPKTEAELIQYALRPDVSTKLVDNSSEQQWLDYLDPDLEVDLDKLRPVVHGLSEVALAIRHYGGYWRIHSNNTVVSMEFSSGANGQPLGRVGKRLPGCLHSILIPMLDEERLSRFYFSSVPIPSRSCTVLDAAEHLYSPSENARPEPDLWRRQVGKFCNALLRTALSRPDSAILLNLSAFDSLPVDLFYPALARVADVMHRTRDSTAIMLCGVNDATMSVIGRSVAWRQFLDQRIIPCISFTPYVQRQGEYIVRVYCSNHLQPIASTLAQVLRPDDLEGALRSSFDDETQWQLCQEVAAGNPGLLHIVDAWEEKALRGRVNAEFADMDSKRLLLGTRASSVAREFVVRNSAAASRQHSLYRLGDHCAGYVHVSFLWADKAFRGAVLSWLPLALGAFDHNIGEDHGADLQLVV